MKGDDAAAGENCCADVGHDEVDGGAGCEAVDEEADGDEETAGEHEGNAEFGTAGGFVAGFEVDVDLWGGMLVLDDVMGEDKKRKGERTLSIMGAQIWRPITKPTPKER